MTNNVQTETQSEINPNPTPNHGAGRFNYMTGQPVPGWPKVKDLVAAFHKKAALEEQKNGRKATKKEAGNGVKKVDPETKVKGILDRLMALDFFKRRPDTEDMARNIAALYEGTPNEAISKAITAIAGDPNNRALAMALNKANQKPV